MLPVTSDSEDLKINRRDITCELICSGSAEAHGTSILVNHSTSQLLNYSPSTS